MNSGEDVPVGLLCHGRSVLHKILIPFMTEMPLKAWCPQRMAKETWREVSPRSCQQKSHPASHSRSTCDWMSSVSGPSGGTGAPAVPHRDRPRTGCCESRDHRSRHGRPQVLRRAPRAKSYPGEQGQPWETEARGRSKPRGSRGSRTVIEKECVSLGAFRKLGLWTKSSVSAESHTSDQGSEPIHWL